MRSLYLLATLLLSTGSAIAGPALEQLSTLAGGEPQPPAPIEKTAESSKQANVRVAAAASFASCKTVMDGIPVVLQLYPERASIELAGVPGLDHKLTILSDDERATRVRMFVYGTTDKVFAEFEVPKAPTSKVEIFAKNFGVVWGVFDCVRPKS